MRSPRAANPVPPPGTAHAPGFCVERARPFLLTAAILASALGFIDSTVVSIALPAMRDSLGASFAQTQWFQNAYMLTLSALILAGGAFADRYGLARVFGIGIALFVMASLGCAAAPSPEVLIAARGLQGVGAAIMVPGSLALIARAYPPEDRGRAIGVWASASAITTALGPVLGGLLLSSGQPEAWRLIFAINLPLGGAALWLLFRFTDTDAQADGAGIDWPGAVLATLGLGLVAWGLSAADHGGSLTGTQGAALAAGLGTLGVFLVVEARSPSPMLPLGLFRNRAFAAANLLTLFLYFALSAVFFFLPMTVIGGWGRSPLEASVTFVPMAVLIGLLSPRVGKLADTLGPRLPLMVGSLIVSVSYAAMALAAPAGLFWIGIAPAAVLLGVGMALVVGPLSTTVMGSVADTETGIASAINNAVSRIAGLLAIATLGPVVGIFYASWGGPDSFGAISASEGHGFATGAAFAGAAAIASALALTAALVAWRFIPAHRPPDDGV